MREMEVLEELKREYRELLRELELENVEELYEMRYSSIAFSRAKRKRGSRVYRWLILTGKVRENGKVRTKLIRNFYRDLEEAEPKLRRLVKLYRAIRVLSE